MSLPETIDEAAFVAEVRRLAAENPDFVYSAPEDLNPTSGPTCLYVHRTEAGELVGGCLIGQAFINIGLPVDEVAKFDTLTYGGATEVLGVFNVSKRVRAWAGTAQQCQDLGDCWAEAVARADREIELEKMDG